METIPAIKITNNGPYRCILKKGEYTINESGQIILHEGYHSKRFFEGLTEVSWEDLPELGKVDSLKHICLESAVTKINDRVLHMSELNEIPIDLKREVVREL